MFNLPQGMDKDTQALLPLDKFRLDQVFNLPKDKDNDTQALLDRISQRHGIRIVYRAEEMGLGSTEYVVKDIG